VGGGSVAVFVGVAVGDALGVGEALGLKAMTSGLNRPGAVASTAAVATTSTARASRTAVRLSQTHCGVLCCELPSVDPFTPPSLGIAGAVCPEAFSMVGSQLVSVLRPAR
jgi:hypothetical protein